MKRVVILGCENSHANTFLNYIRDIERYKDVDVVGVYSDDKEAAEKLRETYGVPLMSSYDEAVGKVDGVIVTARHGDNHYKYARPYIASGVPMFIDKPITVSETDALALARECREHGVRITGGSSCMLHKLVAELKADHEQDVDGKTLGGIVRAPISMHNDYGDFFFYSQHLTEVVMEIYGRYPKSVYAKQEGNTVSVIFNYDGYQVLGLFTDGSYKYYAGRMTKNGTRFEDFSDLSACFLAEFEHIYELLEGGEQQMSYEDFIAPVFVLNAINTSLNTGVEVSVNKFEI